VYIIDGTPRYVGKGTNGRDTLHLKHAQLINARRATGEKVTSTRWYNYLAKALRNGHPIQIVRVAENLTDEQAWDKEIELIMLHGRKGIDCGTLMNECNGGNGSTSADMKRLHADPVYRASFKAKMQKHMQKLHADPVYRANHKAAIQKRTADPKWRASNKVAIQKLHADPVYQANHKAAVQKFHVDPVYRANQKAATQKLYADPTWRANQKAAMQKLHADPKYKAAMQKRSANPEDRANLKKGWARHREIKELLS
jgi:hypothetical protein